MKLLITGGCGFLGSNLAQDALSRGDDLIIFDNLYREGSRANLLWLQQEGEFRFEYGDIRNENDITRIIKNFKPDAIFHLAGQVAMTTSIANPRMDFEVNALGTLNLLEAVRQYAPDAAVIYSSTNKVYGDLEQFTYRETETRYECIEHPNGFDENIPLSFHSPYGCSKGAADQYMLDYARIYGLKTVVFRHSSMYGGRQFATYDQGWIGWFCQKAIETKKGILNEPFTISGNGKQVRDVLHVDDILRLYFSSIKSDIFEFGLAYNVGGGVAYSLSLLELFKILSKEIALDLSYIICEPRYSDQKVFIANTYKVKKEFKWSLGVEPTLGIKEMLNWLTENIR